MPERELVGLGTDGAGQQLVSEADPENRHFTQESIDLSPHVDQWPWITGTIGQEDAVWVHGQYLGRRG